MKLKDISRQMAVLYANQLGAFRQFSYSPLRLKSNGKKIMLHSLRLRQIWARRLPNCTPRTASSLRY